MPSPSNADESDLRIDSDRVFKYAPEQLIGRDDYLRRLDTALVDASTHIVTLVAWGGVGKTSLVAHWMARLAQRNWPGLDHVFAWSFYRQGTGEQGGASSDEFVKAALEFLGDAELAGSAAAARAKGQRIARLAAERLTLLVLDGLEPLQHPPAPSILKAGSRTQLLRHSSSRSLSPPEALRPVPWASSLPGSLFPTWAFSAPPRHPSGSLNTSLLRPVPPCCGMPAQERPVPLTSTPTITS